MIVRLKRSASHTQSMASAGTCGCGKSTGSRPGAAVTRVAGPVRARRARAWLAAGLVSLACVNLSPPASAQSEASLPPSSVPAGPYPVLNCAPTSPAPEDSCVLRVPPGHQRGDLSAQPTATDTVDPDPQFKYVRGAGAEFPNGLNLAEVGILVDLTPGPKPGRQPTFDREKAILHDFAAALPAGVPVALYGFHEDIELLVPFGASRAELLSGIDGLVLKGNNTLLSLNATRMIGLLAERGSAILPNLVLVSDGEEEGKGTADEVVAAASQAGVSVSALAMIWRPAGQAANAPGSEYLQRITQGSSGSFARIDVRNATESRSAAATFTEAFNGPLTNSGLIVPTDTPRQAIITVRIDRPVLGASGQFEGESFSALFTPTAAAPAPVEPPNTGDQSPNGTEPEEVDRFPTNTHIGIGAGAVGALLLIGAVAMMMMRKRPAAEPGLVGAGGGPAAPGIEGFDFPTGGVEGRETAFVSRTTPAAAPPAAMPFAFLVRRDPAERLGVKGVRALIGRGQANDINLADESVSRSHAELRRDRSGVITITDLGSLNGTWVNGKRITAAQRLADGDTLRFGEVETRFILV